MCIIQFIAKRYKKLFELGVIKMKLNFFKKKNPQSQNVELDNLSLHRYLGYRYLGEEIEKKQLEELKNIKEKIKKGLSISDNKQNRCYLRSSFKRIVREWDHYSKNIKIGQNNSKYSICDLRQKMKDHAEYYLNNKKDYDENNNIVRNKVKYDCAKKILTALTETKEALDTLFNEVKSKVQPVVQGALTYYKNHVSKNLKPKQINEIFNKIKYKDNITAEEITKQLSNANTDATITNNFIKYWKEDTNFQTVASCYLKGGENTFTEWLKTEWHYLKNFKSLSAERLSRYSYHGSVVELSNLCTEALKKYTSLRDLIKNLPDRIFQQFKDWYSDLKDLSTSEKIDKIESGVDYFVTGLLFLSPLVFFILVSPYIFVAIVCGLFGLAITPFAVYAGLLARAYYKPLYKAVESQIKKATKKITKLTTMRKNTDELNKLKVEYMRNIKENYNK